MRLGFFIGFLIGAAIASLLTLSEQEDVSTADSGPLDQLKRQAREAREAGRQAADEKEREMLQEWEAARHRSH
jgi:hypothetical protein